MDYLFGCLGGVLCVLCGVWAAKGFAFPKPKPPDASEEARQSPDDLSRDIAAMLAYQLPGKEDAHASPDDTDR